MIGAEPDFPFILDLKAQRTHGGRFLTRSESTESRHQSDLLPTFRTIQC